MSNETLSCSESECANKLINLDSLSLADLEKLNIKCSNCGNWILKENEVANKTYEAVSNKWAEKFMSTIIVR